MHRFYILLFSWYCSCFLVCAVTFVCPCRQAEPPSKKQTMEFSHPSQPSELKLPDASFLLNSPSMPANLDRASDHSSRVAAAMAENATKKRDLSGPASSSYPRSKVPKGPLPHMKNFPDTVGGNLLPPQLAGRWVWCWNYCRYFLEHLVWCCYAIYDITFFLELASTRMHIL